jgi:hypothetical protein
MIQFYTREWCLIFKHIEISQSIHDSCYRFLSESQFLGYKCKKQNRMKDWGWVCRITHLRTHHSRVSTKYPHIHWWFHYAVTKWAIISLSKHFLNGYFSQAGDQATETKFAPSTFSCASFSKELEQSGPFKTFLKTVTFHKQVIKQLELNLHIVTFSCASFYKKLLEHHNISSFIQWNKAGARVKW